MTPKEVEARFEEAAETLRKMRNLTSRDVPQQLRSTHPDIVRSFHEAYGYNAPKLCREPPTKEQIARLDEVIEWTFKLSIEERKLIWERANHVPWKTISRRLHCDRTTAWREWCVVIGKITMITTGCVLQHISMQHIEQNSV